MYGIWAYLKKKNFFKGLSVYLETWIRIRIRIRVKSRIRIRINLMRIQNTVPPHPPTCPGRSCRRACSSWASRWCGASGRAAWGPSSVRMWWGTARSGTQACPRDLWTRNQSIKPAPQLAYCRIHSYRLVPGIYGHATNQSNPLRSWLTVEYIDTGLFTGSTDNQRSVSSSSKTHSGTQACPWIQCCGSGSAASYKVGSGSASASKW